MHNVASVAHSLLFEANKSRRQGVKPHVSELVSLLVRCWLATDFII